MPLGFQPAAKSSRAPNELAVRLPGVLMFLKMESWLGNWTTAAKSSLPSPSRSPSVTVLAQPPVEKFTQTASELVSKFPDVLVLR